MLGAWTWAWRVCTGNWLEMSGVVVAIGCIVYECLEHGSIFMQLLCLVTESGCYKVCMLILFRCASEDSRGSRGLQVCRSEVETNIYTGNFACGVGIYFFLFVINQIIHTDKEGRVLKTC